MIATSSSTIAVRILWHYVTVFHGGESANLLSLALVAVAVILPAWAIGHAVGTPNSTFDLLGSSKRRWIGWMVALFLLGDASGLVLAVYYLARIRPLLRRAT